MEENRAKKTDVPETELCIDTTVHIEKVPIIRHVVNLLTLENYKDRGSITDTLLDENVSNPELIKIAKAIQIEDEKKRKKALATLQKNCSYSTFQKVKQILDDKEYKYDTVSQIVGWRYQKALARCWTRKAKPSTKPKEAEKIKEPNNKTQKTTTQEKPSKKRPLPPFILNRTR